MSDIQMPDGVTSQNNTNTSQNDDVLEEIVKSNKKLNESLKLLQETNEDVNETLQDNQKKDDDNRKQDKKDKEEEKKERFRFLENTRESLKTNAENIKTSITSSLAAPFALITEPLQKITGLDLGSLFGSLKKDLLGLGKKGKKKPTEEDVAQSGKNGTGFLYLGGLFKKFFGNKDDKEGMDFLKGFSGLGGSGLSAMIAKALPAVTKGLGIGALVGGIIWAMVDGIRAFFKSDEWGVSKIGAVIGGVLAGTGSGIKSAFSNAGKWALIGVGAGLLIGGPLGGLVGGLIGAVLGGVLGYFGGEKISKAVDNIGKGIAKFFKEVFGDLVGRIADIWKDKESSIASKIGKTMGRLIVGVPVVIFKFWKGIFTRVGDFLISMFVGKKDSITGKVSKPLIKHIGSFLLDVGKGLFSFFGDLIKKGIMGLGALVSNIGAFIQATIIPGVKDFFKGIFSEINMFIEGNPILKTIKDIVLSPFIAVFETFSAIKESLSQFENPAQFASHIYQRFTGAITGFFDKILLVFDFFKEKGLASVGLIAGMVTKGGREKFQEELTSFAASKLTQPSATINDGIVTKTGKVIQTSPQDNIFATKKEIVVGGGGNSSNDSFQMLNNAIMQLSNKIAMLEPKILQQTNVVKAFAGAGDLKTFDR